MIVGVGEPVKAPCRFGGEGCHVYLWHHAGNTLLVSGGLYRVDDGHLTLLADGPGELRMSHDGRYATWGCPTLEVYAVATGTRLARSSPDGGCIPVEAIDDLGRLYVTAGYERGVADLDLRMYDTRTDRWARIVGIPEGAARFGFLNYVPADGIAAPAEEYAVATSLNSSSIEGHVDANGNFIRSRTVPVGRGMWSPDRTRVVEHRPEGVVVRPTGDLDSPVLLDLPPNQFRGTHNENTHPEHAVGVARHEPTPTRHPTGLPVRRPVRGLPPRRPPRRPGPRQQRPTRGLTRPPPTPVL